MPGALPVFLSQIASKQYKPRCSKQSSTSQANDCEEIDSDTEPDDLLCVWDDLMNSSGTDDED